LAGAQFLKPAAEERAQMKPPPTHTLWAPSPAPHARQRSQPRPHPVAPNPKPLTVWQMIHEPLAQCGMSLNVPLRS
jgi:hypothetical protein